ADQPGHSPSTEDPWHGGGQPAADRILLMLEEAEHGRRIECVVTMVRAGGDGTRITHVLLCIAKYSPLQVVSCVHHPRAHGSVPPGLRSLFAHRQAGATALRLRP